MANVTKVTVPDIGDASGVEIIELMVAVGDTVELEDGLIVLETDKATMEVPSSAAGVITSLAVNVGDKVSEGDLILEIEASDSVVAESPKEEKAEVVETQATEEAVSEPKVASQATPVSEPEATSQPIIIPDLGDADGVDVIEVSISVGDNVEKDDALIVLETDKATMEVPAESAGTIEALTVKVGDKVSQGDQIGTILATADAPKSPPVAKPEPAKVEAPTKSKPTPVKAPVADYPVQTAKKDGVIHASPAVRRLAREFGADLSKVKGTGPKDRILKEDVQAFIKFELSRPKATAGSAQAAPDLPEIDFSKFGEVETTSLTRIQKISSVTLQRNWNLIPHVTQHEDADITELDAFRKSMKEEALKQGVRLTPLAFVMKALVASLKEFPTFNSSLAADGETLVLKKYFNIGVAVDTPDGLVVPVIRDVDKKSVYELANELGEMSAKARDKKLTAKDMQGSSMTISSLGGIGGTAFTPIVNWPDVAILGLSRNKMQPVWNGKEFAPRMMLPMSLSYDHRVIDGAVAARFIVHLSKMLEDIRRIIL